jgi:hypothetical protein
MIIEKCKKIITRLGWNEKNTYLCYMKNKTKTNIVFGLIFGLVGILGILGITMFISIM